MLSSVIENLPVSEQIDLVKKWKKFQEEYQNLSDEDRLKRNIDTQIKNYNNLKSDIELNFFCDKCKNKGQVALGYYDFNNDYKIMFKDCECKAKREIYFNMRNSGFISSDKKYTFENFTIKQDYEKNIFARAKSNLNSNNWFFIGGQIGCGKTHICTAISIELLKMGRSLKMISWRDLITDIKNSFNGKECKYDFEKYKKIEILFIDDFLHGNTTEFELEKAFEIIDFRYRNDLKTIISSELVSGGILNLMQSTGSRIIEKSKGFICDIKQDNNKNHRLLKK